jgi:O-antigen/teichoic acid export membrane protein
LQGKNKYIFYNFYIHFLKKFLLKKIGDFMNSLIISDKVASFKEILLKLYINLLQSEVNSYFKSSAFIMLNYTSSAFFGFFFWVIAARLYTPKDVGLGTTLISSIFLIILLSRLGMDVSLIRFFSSYNKNNIINTTLIVTTLAAIFLGLIFIFIINIFLPELAILRQIDYKLIFLLNIIVNSLINITGISFIALKEGKYYFLQSILSGPRLIFIIYLSFLGSIGILGSLGLSFITALLFSLNKLAKFGIKARFEIDRQFLKESFSYSAGNYIAVLLYSAPNLIMPIITLSLLGAESTAYYYISFSFISLIYMIPGAVGTSLFVSGSNDINFKDKAIKSLIVLTIILILIILFILFISPILLGFLGEDYSIGVNLIRIMTPSVLFSSICQVYISIKRIQKDIIGLIAVS